jgi:hypothetical protein
MARRVAWFAAAPIVIVVTAMLLIAGCELVPVLRHGSGSPRPAPEVPSGALAFQVGDPPGRAIHLSFLQGAVSFRAAGAEVWARAELNRPLVEGDALWADVADRAELDLASAAVRMDARTSLELLRFDDRVAQAKVTEGVIGVAMRRAKPDSALEIDTPNAAITFLAPGEYRMDIEPDIDTTFITVRGGEVEVSGTHLEFLVHAGERVQISGPDAMEYGRTAARAADSFDQFCASREQRVERSISARYVAPDMNGYYDLDDSGAWREDARLGPVWTPRGLHPSWTPYRFGHWDWIEPWGWTWIDDAPWGFAPFHYGRWALLDGVWSWIPGARNVRSVYAPALVMFARESGRNAGLLAWFPLGPGEAYVPAYGCSASYLENLDRASKPAQRYANLSARGAVTAATRAGFLRGEFFGGTERLITVAAVPVAPTAESLEPRRDRFVVPPPQRTQTTSVVGRRDPALLPIPFAERQAMLSAHPGRPLEPGEVETLRRASTQRLRTDVRPARLHQSGFTSAAGE